MRKLIVCALVALTAVSTFAATYEDSTRTVLADSVRVRNPHHNVLVNVGAGMNTMVYQLDKKYGVVRPGGGVQVQGLYQYMFNENWGIGAGIGFSSLNSKAVFKEHVFEGQPTTKGASQSYIPSIKISRGWTQVQNMISIDIPVQAFYHYTLNDKWALQAGLGLTLNFLPWASDHVSAGWYERTADFSGSMGGNFVVGGEDITGHGLGAYWGTYIGGPYAHKKVNVGMQADFGGLYNLTELLDLYFGIYLDAQFIPCTEKKYEELINPNENLSYPVQTTQWVKGGVNPLEFGVKVGVRIGMRDKEKEQVVVDSIIVDRLNSYKSATISEVGQSSGLEDGEISVEMQAIVDKYAEAIRNASSKEEADALKAQALEEIDLQKYKEAGKSDVAGSINEGESDEVRAIAAAYKNAIQNATSKEEVDRLKAECAKAIQNQRDKEEADRQEQLRRERAEEEASLCANLNVNSPVFNKKAQSEIDSLVAYLESHPDDVLCITGHNDATGNTDKDIFLAQERADAYKAALVARGVPEDRIICFSKGSEEPIADNKTAAGRAANRRVSFGVRSKAEVEAEQTLAEAHKLAWEVEQARLARESGLDKVIDTRNVTFSTNSDVPVFNEVAIEGVKTVAAFMEQNPNKKLVLTGHTDNTGEAAYNVILGKRRAEGYKTTMVENGINADRVECDSKGPYQPIESNSTKEGRAANRRVEMAFENIETAETGTGVLVDVPAVAQSEAYPMLTEARANALNAMASVIVVPDEKQIEIFNLYAAKVNKSNTTDAIAAVEKAFAQALEEYLNTL